MAGPATLGVSLSGPDLGSGYAQLQVSGNATLAGELEITLTGGFEPQVGESFVILTFGSRSGEFAQIAGTGAGPGKMFRVEYNSNNVTLMVEALAPGDCDADGDVDLNDYEAFAACLDGPVDGDDDADLADFAEFQIAFTE
jgi:hypothetical protein